MIRRRALKNVGGLLYAIYEDFGERGMDAVVKAYLEEVPTKGSFTLNAFQAKLSKPFFNLTLQHSQVMPWKKFLVGEKTCLSPNAAEGLMNILKC